MMGGVDEIHMPPGSRVLYLGAASGTTVSHVSDVVGPVSTKANGDILIFRLCFEITLKNNQSSCRWNSVLKCTPSIGFFTLNSFRWLLCEVKRLSIIILGIFQMMNPCSDLFVKTILITTHYTEIIILLPTITTLTSWTNATILMQEGLVYAVEFSHRSGRDLINVAKKRTNIIPIIEDARHPLKYRYVLSHLLVTQLILQYPSTKSGFTLMYFSARIWLFQQRSYTRIKTESRQHRIHCRGTENFPLY